eukprot:gnl/Dysnectes_brevis/7668_a13081_244.p1 GENE.gnl/Dysnectes_brevis/7668_a13081_244~~gnl/Dysnectes_brevis/7668_a13081_244.p1  ORF type:complete len:447 (-),score=72.82 gnl/Dysnectes_brevis/7668_a13081_244:22-1362(-)
MIIHLLFTLTIFTLCDSLNITAVDFYPPIRAPSGQVSKSDATLCMLQNIDAMDEIITLSPNSDIFIFPEYSLTSLPSVEWTYTSIQPFLESIDLFISPSDRSHPRDESTDTPAMNALSELATRHSIWLVVCGGEVSTDGQFNTQLVFNRNGDLVTYYRKTHLYFESWYDPGDSAPVTFELEGWTVGLAVCYDLLYLHPVLDYIGTADLLLVSLRWTSTWPIMGGLETQRALTELGVWVAASGTPVHGPDSSGSGIFGPGGEVHTVPPSDHTAYVTAGLPASPPPRARPLAAPGVWQEGTGEGEVSTVVFDAAVGGVFSATSGDMACWADVDPAEGSQGYYALLVFADRGGSFCAKPMMFGGVVACPDEQCVIPDASSRMGTGSFRRIQLVCRFPPYVSTPRLHVARSGGDVRGDDLQEWEWDGEWAVSEWRDVEVISATWVAIPGE